MQYSQDYANVENSEPWEFSLYIAGHSPKSILAHTNLKKICQEHLQGRYAILLVDLLEQPALASEVDIVAVPTLIKHRPEPACTIVGDLSDTARTLEMLQLRGDPSPEGNATEGAIE